MASGGLARKLLTVQKVIWVLKKAGLGTGPTYGIRVYQDNFVMAEAHLHERRAYYIKVWIDRRWRDEADAKALASRVAEVLTGAGLEFEFRFDEFSIYERGR